MDARNVLILEDQIIIATDLAQIVEGIPDCHALRAGSAAEAMRAAAEQPIDLALLDIYLNEATDGVEVAVQLLTQFCVKSIFVSAYLNTPTKIRAERANPVGYIEKPYAAQDVRAAIERGFTEPRPRLPEDHSRAVR